MGLQKRTVPFVNTLFKQSGRIAHAPRLSEYGFLLARRDRLSCCDSSLDNFKIVYVAFMNTNGHVLIFKKNIYVFWCEYVCNTNTT